MRVIKKGDKVVIKKGMWETHKESLTRFGFREPSGIDAYEVSEVFSNGIALKGCTNIYNEEYFEVLPEESSKNSALNKQVSGNHYKDCGIQPIEYIHANGLSYFQGNVIKYVTRYKDKAGKADLEKAIHYLELMIEMEYGDK